VPPLKTPFRVLLAVASGFVLLGLVAWLSTFLYWHVRIGKAIRCLETRRGGLGATPPDVLDARNLLADAKCRAVPYLLAELEPGNPPDFLHDASIIISLRSTEAGIRSGTVSMFERLVQAREWVIETDEPETIREKAALIRAWWENHRAEYHPWWRIWSWRCES
jgi:hypothetical protein